MEEYQITPYLSSEDQAFSTEDPSGMTQGDDQEPPQRNLSDVMQLWVERSRKLGQLFPQPNGLMLANKRQQPKQDLLQP